LGGMLAPLDVFPPTVAAIARYLPFRYMLSFPVEMLLGKASLSDVLIGFGIIVFWVIAFAALARFLWQRGLRQFGAFGA
jgi:ABC-2 type transport system permease protein